MMDDDEGKATVELTCPDTPYPTTQAVGFVVHPLMPGMTTLTVPTCEVDGRCKGVGRVIEVTLEEKFTRLWCGLSCYWLCPQYRGIEDRKFAFDFAHPEAKVAVEIQGGTWRGGRHNTGTGYERDRERGNLAVLQGWAVFELTGKMITPDWVYRIEHHRKEAR